MEEKKKLPTIDFADTFISVFFSFFLIDYHFHSIDVFSSFEKRLCLLNFFLYFSNSNFLEKLFCTGN